MGQVHRIFAKNMDLEMGDSLSQSPFSLFQKCGHRKSIKISVTWFLYQNHVDIKHFPKYILIGLHKIITKNLGARNTVNSH